MPKLRKEKPKQPAQRPSVSNMRVAATRPAKPQPADSQPANQQPATPKPAKPLEPADSFDLGDGAIDSELAAGELLGRKVSAASRKKKEAKRKKLARPSAASQKKAAQAASSQEAGDGWTSMVPASPGNPISPQGVSAAGQARNGETGARDERSPKKKRPAKSLRKKILIALGSVLGVALLVAAAIAGFWAWDTWLRYDDAADIQGEWTTGAPPTSVTIDSEAIHMPDSVDFAYTLNTNEKTIAFNFSTLSGGGSYEFSEDRNTLTITELDGSQTVFTRIGSAEATAQSAASSASDEAASAAADAADVEASSADDDQLAEVSEALESTSQEHSPGSNAVSPGGASSAE